MRSLHAAVLACAAAVLLSGCGDAAVRPARGDHPRVVHPAPSTPLPPLNNPSDKDGPPRPEEVPPDVATIPDAVPVPEARSSYGNPDSYEVYGDHYVILRDARGYKERGYASWYGKKFHGKRTSSGEPYDMFKMTAAHKTLPIPCYAKVTNLENGRSVVVRINDRGPFHEGRIIDLSYAAAVKLGSLGKGSIAVEVEAVDPNAAPVTQMARAAPPPAPAPAPPRPSAPVVTVPVPVQVQTAAATPAAPPPIPAPAPAPVQTASIAPPAQHLALAPSLNSAGAPPASAPTVAVPPPAEGAVIARYLQTGLFYDPINAVSMREQLSGLGIANVLLKNDVRNGANVSRVLIGPFADEGTLALVRKRLGDLQMSAVPVVE